MPTTRFSDTQLQLLKRIIEPQFASDLLLAYQYDNSPATIELTNRIANHEIILDVIEHMLVNLNNKQVIVSELEREALLHEINARHKHLDDLQKILSYQPQINIRDDISSNHSIETLRQRLEERQASISFLIERNEYLSAEIKKLEVAAEKNTQEWRTHKQELIDNYSVTLIKNDIALHVNDSSRGSIDVKPTDVKKFISEALDNTPPPVKVLEVINDSSYRAVQPKQATDISIPLPPPPPPRSAPAMAAKADAGDLILLARKLAGNSDSGKDVLKAVLQNKAALRVMCAPDPKKTNQWAEAINIVTEKTAAKYELVANEHELAQKLRVQSVEQTFYDKLVSNTPKP